MDVSLIDRTPLKEVKNHSSAGVSSAAKYSASKRFGLSSFDFSSSSSNALDMDKTQARIEYLEKERLELSMQLHGRDEKDRERKIKLEQMEAHLKIVETSKNNLQAQLDTLRSEYSELKYDARQIEEELEQLKNKSQSASLNEAENFWNRMSAMSKELGRANQEVDGLKAANNKLYDENQALVERTEQLVTNEAEARTRVLELEAELEATRADVEEAAAQLQAVTQERDEMSTAQQSQSVELAQAVEQTKAAVLRADDLQRQFDESEKERGVLSSHIEALRGVVDAKDLEMADNDRILKKEIEDLTKSNKELKLKASEAEELRHIADAMAANSANGTKQESSDSFTTTATSSKPDDSMIAAVNAEMLQTIAQLKEKLAESDKKRRELHNKLQDLRGNVRVFVRCRPFLSGDGADAQASKTSLVQCHKDNMSISMANPMTSSSSSSNISAVQHFAFDRIFNQETDQEAVYGEVKDLVQSALDGYRVCIFSYGQTGSGR